MISSSTTTTTNSIASDHDPDKHAVDASDASESASSNETSLNPKNTVFTSSTTVIFEEITLTGAALLGPDSVPASGSAATASKADHDAVDSSASSVKHEEDENGGDIIDDLIAMGWDPRGRPTRPTQPAPVPIKPKPNHEGLSQNADT